MKLFGPEKASAYLAKKEKEREDVRQKAISRRKFLGLGAVAVGALALKSPLGKLIERFTQSSDQNESGDEFSEKDLFDEAELTEEQEEEREKEMASIREILDFDKDGRLKFNVDSVEKIKQYWKKRYSEPPLINDFKSAFKKMGAWQNHLKELFRAESVPEEFIYLAIPESHWRIQSRSPKNAAGPLISLFDRPLQNMD